MPAVDALTRLPDGSMALALEYVDGRPLDELAPDEIDADLLDAVWREVGGMHRAGSRTGRCAPPTSSSPTGGPSSSTSASAPSRRRPRLQAIDRAELLVSLADARRRRSRSSRRPRGAIGADDARGRRAVPAAARPLGRDPQAGVEGAAAGAPRRRSPTITGEEPAPLERLVRVRARTLVMIAALTAAFYVLLPQLADVGDSVDALGAANWWWLVVCVVMSLVTYVAAAIGLAGGVPEPLPFVAQPRRADGVVVRQPGHAGQRRRDGAQPALPAEGRRRPRDGVTGIGLNVAGRRDRPPRAALRVRRVGGAERHQQLQDPDRAARSSSSSRSCSRSSASPSRRDGDGASSAPTCSAS